MPKTRPAPQPEQSEPSPAAAPLGAETVPPGVTPQEARTYLQAIDDNYAQFVATQQIHWGSALAFNDGDPVPADYPTLKQLLADGMVKPVKKTR